MMILNMIIIDFVRFISRRARFSMNVVRIIAMSLLLGIGYLSFPRLFPKKVIIV